VNTLFTEPELSSQDPFSLFLSVLAHGGAIALLSLVLRYDPPIIVPPLTERYVVRLLELHTPEPQAQPTELASLPAVEKPMKGTYSHNSADAAPPQAPARRARQLPARPVLIQPHVSPSLILTEDIPLPLAVIWSAEDRPKEKIVAPVVHEEAAADVRPILALPNKETSLADLKIASTAFAPMDLPILPSTTSPLAARDPKLMERVPETTSTTSGQTPVGRVVSLSDLRVRDGIVPLPRANQASAVLSGTVEGSDGSSQDGSETHTGTGSELLTRRIRPPRNGKFGVVVVGASLDAAYPETAGLWSGRLAYTVYLHVGLAKSWILQYSQPRPAQAAATGGATRLEAPWPTDLVVPNLAPGSINVDALLVHGFLNKDGHFENLAVIFPPQFAQAEFVLGSLQQCVFRPALQNGQNAIVEILLIIPEQDQ
jgi:hypothetical protein